MPPSSVRHRRRISKLIREFAPCHGRKLAHQVSAALLAIVRRSAGTASLLKEAARALLDRPCRSSANIISDEGPCSFRCPPSTARSRGPRCLQLARASGVPERSGRVPYIRLPHGGTDSSNPTPFSHGLSKNSRKSAIIDEWINRVLSPILSQRQKKTPRARQAGDGPLRHRPKSAIGCATSSTSPIRTSRSYSHRHTAISYLRNTRLPDGSPAVKEDVERYLTGHARKGAHAGYGKQWIETLKAAIQVILDPLSGEESPLVKAA